jgi:hypothetical protein
VARAGAFPFGRLGAGLPQCDELRPVSPVMLDGACRLRRRGTLSAQLENAIALALAGKRAGWLRWRGVKVSVIAGRAVSVTVPGEYSITAASDGKHDYLTVQVAAAAMWSGATLAGICRSVDCSGMVAGVGRWRPTKIEMCRDGTGVRITAADIKIATMRKANHFGVTQDGGCETIAWGKRSSTTQLVWYNKTIEQLKQHHTKKYQAYLAVWLACGWDGVAPLHRMEVRLSGRDLRRWSLDPARWDDQSFRVVVFSTVLAKKRMDSAGDTDPRWAMYMDKHAIRPRLPSVKVTQRAAGEVADRLAGDAVRAVSAVAAAAGIDIDAGQESWQAALDVALARLVKRHRIEPELLGQACRAKDIAPNEHLEKIAKR